MKPVFNEFNFGIDMVPDAAKKLAAASKKSKQKEKKDTYTIALDGTVGLNIVTVNGHVAGRDVCAPMIPMAELAQMYTEHTEMTFIYGRKMATTIIEYRDKDTNAPIAVIYPQGFFVYPGYESNYRSRMNHATRRDFEYQIRRRAHARQLFCERKR